MSGGGAEPAREAGTTDADAFGASLRPAQILIVFDGRCGVCSRIARRMVRLDRRQHAAWMPSQRAGLPEAAGLAAEDVASAAWAVTPSGARLRGAAAMLAGLDAALLGGRARLHALHRVPGLRQALDAGYAWFARNRGRFQGTAACDIRPPAPLDAASRKELAARGRRGGWAPLDALSGERGDGAEGEHPDRGVPGGPRASGGRPDASGGGALDDDATVDRP